jgi:hypothetical protein
MKRLIGFWIGLICLSAIEGCSSPQKVSLMAAPDQESIVRNGIPALISQKKNLVMIRPNTRLLRGNSRPAFTLVVRNQGRSPITLHEADVSARQVVAGKTVPVRVFKYDELVEEEETRQTLAAVGAALSGVGRAMSAANAGYVHTTGSVNAYGPYGMSHGTYSAITYDPARAQIAQNIAANQTQADFAQLRAQGEANLDGLQATILKDNTVMPGEWYGGTIVLAAPEQAAQGVTTYSVSVMFGGEEHVFAVSHVAS